MRIDEGPRYAPDDFLPHLVEEIPAWLVDSTGGRIPEGRRNDTLFRRACRMRSQGDSEEMISAAISAINQVLCDPPLPEDEVLQIARSACRYPPGARIDVGGFYRPADPENVSAATPPLNAADTMLAFHTAREIFQMTPADVPWTVEGYVAEGAITGVDGKPKAAGKTTWALHMARKVLDGEPFMGLATGQTAVVYLTEQSASTFREALARAGLEDREDFVVLLWRDTVGIDWRRVVREAVEEALRRGAKLLVVDTLPQFAGLQGDTENSAGAALAAVQPLQEAAAVHDLAVVVVRHERKSGGQVGDSGRGSSAFAGAVDVVVSVRRTEGNSRPSIRELHAISRFDETPDLLVVELTDAGYRSFGSRAAVAEAEAREAILDAAPADASDAVSLEELLRATGVARTTAQNAVESLLAGGDLRCIGEGVRGDPRRYWRVGGSGG